ncbi:MAG: phosphate signaling complex protein PhoU [Dehalococcoidia bacterium]
MARETFHQELDDLIGDVIVMGSMAEKAIARAVDSLKNCSMEQAEQVIEDDEKVNRRRFEIEESCIRLIATQQPMARDLRTIVSAIHLATDLERIGDYASGIAEITLLLSDDRPVKSLMDIPRMAEIGIGMLQDSLKSLLNRDAEKAREIARRDDEIDELYHNVLQQCFARMAEDPNIETRLIWVAHKLERIADRVTNICERVTFVVTGNIEELDSA